MTFDLSQIGPKKSKVFEGLTKETLGLLSKINFFSIERYLTQVSNANYTFEFFSQTVILDLSKPGTSKNEKGSNILEYIEKETSLM